MSVYVVDKSPLGEVRKVSTHLGYLVHYAVFLKEDEWNAHSFHSTLTDARKEIGKEASGTLNPFLSEISDTVKTSGGGFSELIEEINKAELPVFKGFRLRRKGANSSFTSS